MYNTYDMADPAVFRSNDSFLGGESSVEFKKDPKLIIAMKKVPERFVYGINSNTNASYL